MKRSPRKTNKSLADRILEEMANSGLTNYRISKEAGVDQAVLSRFCNHERSISLDVADRLCNVLGLELVKKDSTSTRRDADGKR